MSFRLGMPTNQGLSKGWGPGEVLSQRRFHDISLNNVNRNREKVIALENCRELHAFASRASACSL